MNDTPFIPGRALKGHLFPRPREGMLLLIVLVSKRQMHACSAGPAREGHRVPGPGQILLLLIVIASERRTHARSAGHAH